MRAKSKLLAAVTVPLVLAPGLMLVGAAPAKAGNPFICTATTLGPTCQFTIVTATGGTNDEGLISTALAGIYTVQVVNVKGQPQNKDREVLGTGGNVCSVALADTSSTSNIKGRAHLDSQGQPVRWTGSGMGVVSGFFIQGCTYSLTLSKVDGWVTAGQTN